MRFMLIPGPGTPGAKTAEDKPFDEKVFAAHMLVVEVEVGHGL